MSQDLHPSANARTSADEQDGLLGLQLGHYQILSELGQGGMSVVYRARDLRLDREVAIKVLHPFLADRPEAQKRFQREAKAVARLHHPNVLDVYDFSTDADSRSYIVTEFVDGLTLREFADRYGFNLPEISALIGVKLCAALQSAHEQGVIHRDIKPENIMLRGDGVLKLMDFGIAQLRDASSLTATGTLLGSPAHMAPELIDGKEIDERADQFSLGTLLYWMATGGLPFAGNNPHALLKKIVEGRYVPPQQANPQISNAMAQVIKRSLMVDPDQRFASIALLHDELLKLLHDSGIDDVDANLARFVADPKQVTASLRQTVINIFLQRAKKHQAKHNIAPALAAINRVLALDKDNSEGRLVLLALTKTHRRRLLYRSMLKLGLATLLLIVLSLSLWFWISGHEHATSKQELGTTELAKTDPDPIQAGEALSSQADPAAPARGEEPALTSKPTKIKPPTADAKAHQADQKPKLRKDFRVNPKGRMHKGFANRHALNAKQAGVGADSSDLCPVSLRVDPWADVFVDGAPTAISKGIKSTQIKLKPGPHLLRFENSFCEPVKLAIVVPKQGTLQVPAVKFVHMKPAYLVVTSNPTSEISIDGKYWGKARDSLNNAIIITLPDRSSSIEKTITLTNTGMKTEHRKLRFRPGEHKKLKLFLHRKPVQIDAAAATVPTGSAKP